MSIDAVRVPAPVMYDAPLTELLRAQWGVAAGEIVRLGAERDINVLVDGSRVLKVVNPGEPRQIAEMQVAALRHAHRTDPDLPLPDIIATTDGADLVSVTDENGATCLCWLVTRLPGTDREGQPVPADIAHQVGAAAGRMQLALQGFFHQAAGRAIGWDLRRFPEYIGRSGELAALCERVRPALAATAGLPSWVQHADVTLSNVLFAPDAGGSDVVSGVIDFGDMHHTAAVCDLAVTLTSVLRNTAPTQQTGLWELAAAVIDGYQQHRLLLPEEVAVLGELVLARLGVTEAIAGLHAERNEAAEAEPNSHITRYREANRRVLSELASLAPDLLATRLGRIAGTAHPPGGAPAAGPPLLDRRRAVMGGRLSPLFYTAPLHIVRGEGPYLITADGRRLLDAYNNVAVIGHAHPAVTSAVTAQLAALNTHSRYLHRGVVELAERLVATMPDGLDTCLFTTSGTEANELAWRMATAVTHGNAAIVARHSYHGSTKWMADLSPLEWPAGYRAPHVGLFEAPHGLGPGVPESVAADRIAAAAAELQAVGDRPALVLADSMFTSEGILQTPDGFLRGLAAGAHAEGALYLADEVQAGYGRPGADLWRFKASGVVPDFVSLGKPMGAGYPLGALITRREIADALAADYEYFSTFAATPVAAAAGLAVLDVLQDQRIPERAASVGEYLRGRLRELSARYEVLGEVRGVGLLAGVDILAPETTAQPRAVARGILNALVARGVMAGLTGPSGTVLKVRPPLIWETRHADIFVDTLAAVLG